MKILFFLEHYYPKIGGVETLFKSLAEALVQRGYEVTVLTTRTSREMPKREFHNGVEIVRFSFYNRYFFTFLAFFPALNYIRKADMVHTTSYNAGLPAFLAARLLGKKVIITFHEVWGKLWFQLPFMALPVRFLHYLFEQFLLKLPFNAFIAVSDSTARRLAESGVSPKRIQRIYNGIDYAEFPERSPEEVPPARPFVYTYFGRLGISKGLDILLQAAAQFKDQQSASRLKLIIPKEPEGFFKILLKEIERYKLEGHIIFKHNLPFPDLQKELKASHCIVIPSYSEGFCYAAVEAIALGVPLISSDQGALKEVVSGKYIKMRSLSSEALVVALKRAAEGDWEESQRKIFPLNETLEDYFALIGSLGRPT
jgi:glycosyltransferase involved in cell wall biosynthesis